MSDGNGPTGRGGDRSETSRLEKLRAESGLPGVLGLADAVISRFEALVLAAGVLLMALNTVVNVIARFIFQFSIFFTEEVNRTLIVFITFAGISYAARHGRHIRMSAIYDAMPPQVRRIAMIVIAVVTAMMMFALCYFAINYIVDVAQSGRVLSSLRIPVYLIYVWVPVGLFLTGVQYAMTAVKNVLSKDIYLSTIVLEGYEDDEMEV